MHCEGRFSLSLPPFRKLTSRGGSRFGAGNGRLTRSCVVSGGEARRKRRRRNQQHVRPAGANPNQFDEMGWESMLVRLVAFKAMPGHGHCRVPTQGWSADPKLAGWVGKQRTYKRRLDAGHAHPGITKERVAKLDQLGFDWRPPSVDTSMMQAGRRTWPSWWPSRPCQGTGTAGCPHKAGRPEVGRLGQQPAAEREEAGCRPPAPEDHEGAGGQARPARLRVESWWREAMMVRSDALACAVL